MTIIIIILFNLFLYFYFQGPRWYPIVGNLLLLKKWARKLGGQDKVFEKWTHDYKSPIIGVKLGSQLFVIVTTYPLVRAVHTRDEFNGRPDSFFLRLRTMGTRCVEYKILLCVYANFFNSLVCHLFLFKFIYVGGIYIYIKYKQQKTIITCEFISVGKLNFIIIFYRIIAMHVMLCVL